MKYPYETDRESVYRLIREVRELRKEIENLSQRVKALENEREELRKVVIDFDEAIGII